MAKKNLSLPIPSHFYLLQFCLTDYYRERWRSFPSLCPGLSRTAAKQGCENCSDFHYYLLHTQDNSLSCKGKTLRGKNLTWPRLLEWTDRKDHELQSRPAGSGRDCLATEGHEHRELLPFTQCLAKRQKTLSHLSTASQNHCSGKRPPRIIESNKVHP